MKSLWVFNTIIPLPLPEAKKIFFGFREGEFDELSAPLLIAGKGRVKITFDKVMYTIEFADKHREYISIEEQKNRVAVQGEWWYRGEYTLFAFPGSNGEESTEVQLEVFNLADQEWMVSLMNINARRKHELAFISLCKMAERVGSDQ